MDFIDVPTDDDVASGYGFLTESGAFGDLDYEIASNVVDDMVSRPAVRDRMFSPDEPGWKVRSSLMGPFTDAQVGRTMRESFMAAASERSAAYRRDRMMRASSVGADPVASSPMDVSFAVANCKYL